MSWMMSAFYHFKASSSLTNQCEEYHKVSFYAGFWIRQIMKICFLVLYCQVLK